MSIARLAAASMALALIAGGRDFRDPLGVMEIEMRPGDELLPPMSKRRPVMTKTIDPADVPQPVSRQVRRQNERREAKRRRHLLY